MHHTKTPLLLICSMILAGCPLEFAPGVPGFPVDTQDAGTQSQDGGTQQNVDGNIHAGTDSGPQAQTDGGTGVTDGPAMTEDSGPHVPADSGVPLSDPKRLELEIIGGTGSHATVNPGNIICNSTCMMDFEKGTLVTINLNLVNGDSLNRWSGDCMGNGNPCQVRMDEQRTVKAHIETVQHSLQINLGGAGQGTVLSTPTGINCGSDCAEQFDWGTTVTLTTQAQTGSVFAGWVGACSGTGNCVIDLQSDQEITALFEIRQITFTVSVIGDGRIDSTPGGIACGNDCSESYDYGTRVTLQATAGTNFGFAAWGGACAGSGGCTVTLDADKQVTAEFTNAPVPLAVVISGNRGGTVSSAPSGITCPGSCTHDFPRNQSVTLTAQPDTGSQISSWSGACSGSGPTCMVNMDQAKQVGIDFTPLRHQLMVNLGGSAPTGGSVASSPIGISCGTICTNTYNYGSSISLRASARTGFEFDGWSGDCSGTSATCPVSMVQDINVTARFKVKTHSLTASRAGPNPDGGAITSNPGSINCGTQCSDDFDYGDSVILTATPLTGYDFDRWTGNCSSAGSVDQCVLQMTTDRSASARFQIQRHALNVQLTGTGAQDGQVASTPLGIHCGTDCSEIYDHNTQVSLLALGNNGAVFSGWAGACSSTNPVCIVTMTQAKNVSAQFDAPSFELAVTMIGTGAGHILSLPPGIDCPGACTAAFAPGTSVSLWPTPNAYSGFNAWTNDCTGPRDCTVNMTSNQQVSAEFESGLVAFYALDGDGFDNARNGHDASTNVGSGAEGHNGGVNSSIELSQGQFFDIPSDPALSGFNTMTVCAWAYLTSWINNDTYVVSKVYLNRLTSDEDSYALLISNNRRRPVFLVATIDGGDSELAEARDSTSRVPTNVWTHICGVYDGQDAMIYTNGSFGDDDGIAGTVNSTNRSLKLGQCTSTSQWACAGGQSAFNGRLDNIKIYNRALSATEIRTEFQR